MLFHFGRIFLRDAELNVLVVVFLNWYPERIRTLLGFLLLRSQAFIYWRKDGLLEVIDGRQPGLRDVWRKLVMKMIISCFCLPKKPEIFMILKSTLYLLYFLSYSFRALLCLCGDSESVFFPWVFLSAESFLNDSQSFITRFRPTFSILTHLQMKIGWRRIESHQLMLLLCKVFCSEPVTSFAVFF